MRFFRDFPGYLGRFRGQWYFGLPTVALAAFSIAAWATGKRIGLPGGVWITLTFLGVFLSGYGVYRDVRRPDPQHEDHIREIARKAFTSIDRRITPGEPPIEMIMLEEHFPETGRLVAAFVLALVRREQSRNLVVGTTEQEARYAFYQRPEWDGGAAVWLAARNYLNTLIGAEGTRPPPVQLVVGNTYDWTNPVVPVQVHTLVAVNAPQASTTLAVGDASDILAARVKVGVFFRCLQTSRGFREYVAARDAVPEAQRAALTALEPLFQPGSPISGRCDVCSPPRHSR